MAETRKPRKRATKKLAITEGKITSMTLTTDAGAPGEVVEVKRQPPPVLVPKGPVRPTQFAAGGVRTLQTMLHDLGLYNRKIHGHYDNYTRNAVSELQQRLSEELGMKIRPDGVFNQATLDALLDSSIPTTQG